MDNNIIKYGIPFVLSASLILGGKLSIKNEEQCNICQTYHVHLFERNIGNTTIKKWLQRENDTYNYTKSDTYLPSTALDLKFYDTLSNYYLFDGRDNIDFINYQITHNKDYLKFYYYYTEIETYYETDSEGNSIMKTRTVIYDGWTTNPRHRGVTGKVRVYHTRYYSYNVTYNENDNTFNLERSAYFDDIREIITDYPYMSESTNTEVYETLHYSSYQLPYLNVEEITPFYTPTVENNPLNKTENNNLTKTLTK